MFVASHSLSISTCQNDQKRKLLHSFRLHPTVCVSSHYAKDSGAGEVVKLTCKVVMVVCKLTTSTSSSSSMHAVCARWLSKATQSNFPCYFATRR
ncbi:uncharacterized protein PHALS_14564 [Plasmopara halstedii]|uniref:Uncharacterized protein n=1 Tax=Plasmopara halstedii TaxID=4781 RepID=A0A0P1ALK6_PLAHL|nr:uncharacterized protein PHALS_14564 [Plasmopara halstedii]CEG41790.1 hypothetical protein PHALS_14564 [Plasmopara halstedii]|eukprot:XP_024578159.1 hypothetical protein PHALS_14564 [Plasmopara halstedii]